MYIFMLTHMAEWACFKLNAQAHAFMLSVFEQSQNGLSCPSPHCSSLPNNIINQRVSVLRYGSINNLVEHA